MGEGGREGGRYSAWRGPEPTVSSAQCVTSFSGRPASHWPVHTLSRTHTTYCVVPWGHEVRRFRILPLIIALRERVQLGGRLEVPFRALKGIRFQSDGGDQRRLSPNLWLTRNSLSGMWMLPGLDMCWSSSLCVTASGTRHCLAWILGNPLREHCTCDPRWIRLHPTD